MDTPVTTMAALVVLTGAELGQRGEGLELAASPVMSQWLRAGASSNSLAAHIYPLPHGTRPALGTSILGSTVTPLGLSSHLR